MHPQFLQFAFYDHFASAADHIFYEEFHSVFILAGCCNLPAIGGFGRTEEPEICGHAV
jgi:hypothetical protein